MPRQDITNHITNAKPQSAKNKFSFLGRGKYCSCFGPGGLAAGPGGSGGGGGPGGQAVGLWGCCGPLGRCGPCGLVGVCPCALVAWGSCPFSFTRRRRDIEMIHPFIPAGTNGSMFYPPSPCVGGVIPPLAAGRSSPRPPALSPSSEGEGAILRWVVAPSPSSEGEGAFYVRSFWLPACPLLFT